MCSGVEIQLNRPTLNVEPGLDSQPKFLVTFEISAGAHLLLAQAPPDLVMFAKPMRPQVEKLPHRSSSRRTAKGAKGPHGDYWYVLFKKRGLGYCQPLKDAMKIPGANSEELHHALQKALGVTSLSFVSPRRFGAWLATIGLDSKVPW
jgi:hypothetical protein